MAQAVYILCQNRERSSNSQNRQWLNGDSAYDVRLGLGRCIYIQKQCNINVESTETYKEKIIPQSPVLKTTSMVPQFLPVRTYRSLANVIPGNKFVKNTYTALAKIN